ncbi:MAG: hypothetical protein GY756_16430 [bacterium]|nr:hypothetical protein [bacterium]
MSRLWEKFDLLRIEYKVVIFTLIVSTLISLLGWFSLQIYNSVKDKRNENVEVIFRNPRFSQDYKNLIFLECELKKVIIQELIQSTSL